MSRCRDKVDVLITDSPLPLSILYNRSDVLGEEFNKTVMNCFNSFENISCLLLRDKKYNSKGRLQIEEESNALSEPLIKLLDDRNITYQTHKGNLDGYEEIVEGIMNFLKL